MAARPDRDGQRRDADLAPDDQRTNPDQIAQAVAVVTATMPKGGDFFGDSLAMDGDLLLVGAPRTTSKLGTQENGAAYLFRRNATAWTLEAEFFPGSEQPQLHFGHLVATSDERVLIGSEAEIWSFALTPGGWAKEGTMFAAPNSNVRLTSLSVSGDLAAVGVVESSCCDCSGNIDSVRLYARSSGKWTLETVETILTGDCMSGSSVALSGTTLAVLSPTGATTYLRQSGTWVKEATLPCTPPNAETRSVALAGNVLAISVPFESGAVPKSGAVYLFERAGSTWTPSGKIVASPPVDHGYFGDSVAIGPKHVLVGAPTSTLSARYPMHGNAYAFAQGPGGWTDTNVFTSGEAGWDYFGAAVAASGKWGAVSGGGQTGAVWIYDLAATAP